MLNKQPANIVQVLLRSQSEMLLFSLISSFSFGALISPAADELQTSSSAPETSYFESFTTVKTVADNSTVDFTTEDSTIDSSDGWLGKFDAVSSRFYQF